MDFITKYLINMNLINIKTFKFEIFLYNKFNGDFCEFMLNFKSINNHIIIVY